MLTSLSIKNYALIDDIKVSFKEGLTTITGETGAGKSILLGALSLLLGKRADSSSVKDASKKCVVEGDFSIADYNLEKLFEDEDLDYEVHTIIRREILPSGKSRAFINDTPANLQQLQALGERLVDIHSQHETRSLLEEQQQMEILDAVAINETLLTNYTEILKEFRRLNKELNLLLAEKETAAKELDYHSFLHRELEEAHLDKLNQEELEETFEQLNNAETIQETLASTLQLFFEEPMGTLETAKEARIQLGKLKQFSSKFENFWERLNSVIIELEDVASEVENHADQLEADPEQLLQVQEQLQTLYKLQQKHAVSSVAELQEIEQDLASKIENTNSLDERIMMLEGSISSSEKSLVQVSDLLHNAREAVIPKLKNQLEELLIEVGLPNAQLQFNLEKGDDFKENGADSLDVLFSANKGSRPGALKKVASGGELSRIMLAIKAVLAEHKKMPTLIFDEIDTGVSGEIAQRMAGIMEQMGDKMQVLSITHLPQIAAKGNQQIKVYKEDQENTTATQLKQLTEDERIVEIAQMIGGKTPTESALAHAKQLRN